MQLLNLKFGLVAWAIAGPILSGGVVYLSMMAREAIVVSGAVRVARGEETVKCNAQRAEIAAAINAEANRAIEEARAAASEIKTPANIAELCKASASCRERTAQ